MKFPYGIADFNAVITEDYFYCDRSDRIPLLERMGKYLLFIRPRRFGKSLLVSMLHHYYDLHLTIFFRKIGSKRCSAGWRPGKIPRLPGNSS